MARKQAPNICAFHTFAFRACGVACADLGEQQLHAAPAYGCTYIKVCTYRCVLCFLFFHPFSSTHWHVAMDRDVLCSVDSDECVRRPRLQDRVPQRRHAGLPGGIPVQGGPGLQGERTINQFCFARGRRPDPQPPPKPTDCIH